MAVQTKSDVFTVLRDHHGDLRRLGIRRCGVFGSFVREESRPESDVDLLVEFAPGEKSFDRFMQLTFLLDEAMGRRVELVTTESLSPHLGPRILREVEYAPLGE